MNVKNVIFDLGGVLIDWNPRHMYKKVFANPAEMERFLTHICNDEWNAEQDRGQTLAEATQTLCEQHPDQTHLIQMYYDRWHEMLHGELTGTVEILHRLKHNNVGLYALTNWSHETFPYARRSFPCLNEFLDIVVSGEEKIMKPDPRIFEILLTRNHLLAAECAFVDDKLVNVQAATRLGMVGVHFTAPQHLATELTKLGLL